MIRGNRILVLGRAGMDFYADPPGQTIVGAERFVAALGGSAANIAVAIARLGGRPALLSRLSDDAVGRFCLGELGRFGVAHEHVALTGGEVRSSLAVVETRLEDCQNVLYRNGAADLTLAPDDVQDVDFQGFDALIVTGTALAADPSRSAAFLALERAREAGLTAIIDLDYRPYSWPSPEAAAQTYARAAALCQIVVGNDVEFDVLAGVEGGGLDAARRIVAEGAALAVYKMGDKGAVTLTPGAEVTSGIFRTQALKPTGAGDSFLGAMVMGLSRGLSPEQAVRQGSAAAAMVVARVGCAPAMPDTDELQAFLAARDTE